MRIITEILEGNGYFIVLYKNIQKGSKLINSKLFSGYKFYSETKNL